MVFYRRNGTEMSDEAYSFFISGHCKSCIAFYIVILEALSFSPYLILFTRSVNSHRLIQQLGFRSFKGNPREFQFAGGSLKNTGSCRESYFALSICLFAESVIAFSPFFFLVASFELMQSPLGRVVIIRISTYLCTYT